MTDPKAGLNHVPGGPVRAAILTVSDRASRGEYADLSGPALVERLELAGAVIAAQSVTSDDLEAIAAALRSLCDLADLVLTTGGTGFAPRDVTPEATKQILEREAPGLAEWMRQATRAATPAAVLSRGVCGLRGRTLVINLPGNPRGAIECLEAILDLLPHAVAVARGGGSHAGHGTGA